MMAILVVPNTIFMYITDPYNLIREDYYGKTPPNFHLYPYNLLKKHDKLNYAFLGSSSINYYDIGYMFNDSSSVFSMGIESSTIEEQVEYGKLLAEKQPKEIFFFLSFYSFNPSRNPEKYYSKRVVNLNNKVIDFFDQYFTNQALSDAASYWIGGKKNSEWVQQFNENGTRTQNHYLLDKNYDFINALTSYLTLNYADVRLYGSKSFKDPESLNYSLSKIKEFKTYLEDKNIKLRLIFAPDYKLNTAMIYYMGLGNTYKGLRKKIALIQPFYDLNADTTFTNDAKNYWDAHHVRTSRVLMDDLRSSKYLYTTNTIDSCLNRIEPNFASIQEIKKIFNEYPHWDDARRQADQDKKLNPPKVL